jgi:hypothetical protein
MGTVALMGISDAGDVAAGAAGDAVPVAAGACGVSAEAGGDAGGSAAAGGDAVGGVSGAPASTGSSTAEVRRPRAAKPARRIGPRRKLPTEFIGEILASYDAGEGMKRARGCDGTCSQGIQGAYFSDMPSNGNAHCTIRRMGCPHLRAEFPDIWGVSNRPSRP